MLKIYHNPRCKHSRAGFEHLKTKTDNFKVRDYLKEQITAEEIKEIILKTNLSAKDLARTQEEYFRKNLKGKNFTNDEWIRILMENPKLIQRPIVVGKLKAVIANPPEKIDKLF
jgi:arsenate reductase